MMISYIVTVPDPHNEGRDAVPGAGPHKLIDGDGFTVLVRVVVLDPLSEGVALERTRRTAIPEHRERRETETGRPRERHKRERERD